MENRKKEWIIHKRLLLRRLRETRLEIKQI